MPVASVSPISQVRLPQTCASNGRPASSAASSAVAEPSARGAASRGRRHSRSTSPAAGTTTSSASASATSLQRGRRGPVCRAEHVGCTATDRDPARRRRGRGSSRSCTHSIDVERPRDWQRSSAPATSRAGRGCRSWRRSRPAARRRRSSARSRRPCRRAIVSAAARVALRAPRRRRSSGPATSSGIHTGSPARARHAHQRLGQRGARAVSGAEDAVDAGRQVDRRGALARRSRAGARARAAAVARPAAARGRR